MKISEMENILDSLRNGKTSLDLLGHYIQLGVILCLPTPI